MHPAYEALYSDMMGDINRCQGLELPERERAESCFWIAHHYSERLKEKTEHKTFRDEAEEIEFFKSVKPAFASWMEYFILLSESLLFVPSDRQSEMDYWEGESLRYQRFCQRHAPFVKYLEEGENVMDASYFLRRNAEDLSYVPKAPIYDVDAAFCTQCDGLVKSYMAQKRFYEFARKRIEELKLWFT